MLIRRRHKTGFTLVELLVVVAIIAILIAFLLPLLSRATASARSLKCAANLRQIGQAFAMYRVESDNWLPPVNAFAPHTLPPWDLSNAYGMWNALGPYVGLKEWGGTKDPQGVSPAPNDDVYTGYVKFDGYWLKKTTYRKFTKSVFMCPELWDYDPDDVRAFGAGYGESTYLQSYPSGPSGAYGFPRRGTAVKHPSTAVHVSEMGVTGLKALPNISTITAANYPPQKWGSAKNAFDMYRHFGGCNILFADGHVAYYKGTDIVKSLSRDTTTLPIAQRPLTTLNYRLN